MSKQDDNDIDLNDLPSEDEMPDLERDPNNTPVGAGSDADDAELDNLRREKTALYEKLARVQADYQNSRRRLEAESEQRLQYANADLVKQMLPIIDNFERALAQDPSKVDSASILKGMQLVHDQWLTTLTKVGVEQLSPKVGEPFDPTQHEALMQQDAEYDTPTVTMLMQTGYRMRDRVLRPAQVAVSRSK